MRTTVIYLVSIFMVLLCVTTLLLDHMLPAVFIQYKLLVACALAGGFGGVAYCLRGVYLNKCVHKRWDDDWVVWYFIRPLVSVIMGGVAFVILKAGLLVLDAAPKDGSSHFGFIALSFVAGLNVDRFLEKIEEVAQSVWGIKKSRASQENENK